LAIDVFRSAAKRSGWKVEPEANTSDNAARMRSFALLLVVFSLLSARIGHAQETKIDLNRIHLEVIQGAEAHSTVNNEGPDGQPALMAAVTKTGAEFWSVELWALDVNFEPGKTYEVNFQAKSVPSQFIYVVPEKTDGNQASVAEGTTLKITDQWTDCSVVFHTTDAANPGRLTLSSLAANPVSYWFSNIRISAK
jgi:Carbohydrate binding domain